MNNQPEIVMSLIASRLLSGALAGCNDDGSCRYVNSEGNLQTSLLMQDVIQLLQGAGKTWKTNKQTSDLEFLQ